MRICEANIFGQHDDEGTPGARMPGYYSTLNCSSRIKYSTKVKIESGKGQECSKFFPVKKEEEVKHTVPRGCLILSVDVNPTATCNIDIVFWIPFVSPSLGSSGFSIPLWLLPRATPARPPVLYCALFFWRPLLPTLCYLWAVALEEVEHGPRSLFYLACRINHSCLPNCRSVPMAPGLDRFGMRGGVDHLPFGIS